MKSKLKKLLAVQLVLLILLSAVVVLFPSGINESYAVPKNWTEFSKLQPYNGTKKYFKVYAETDYVKNNIVQQDPNNASRLLVDRGAWIYFDKKMDSITYEVQQADGTWKFYGGKVDSDRIYIDLTLPTEFRVILRKKPSLLSRVPDKQEFLIRVRDLNSMKYYQDENKYAVYSNGTVHVRAGETLKMSTAYGKTSGGRNGEYYVTRKEGNTNKVFEANGYNIQVPKSSVTTAFINWRNNFNASIIGNSFRIRSSNFITDSKDPSSYTLSTLHYNPKYSGPNTLYITDVRNEKCGVYTDYRIVAGHCTGELKLEFIPKREYADIPIVFDGLDGNRLEVDNIPGYEQVFDKCDIEYLNNRAYITLNLRNPGPIVLRYNDWLGQKRVIYWYIDDLVYDYELNRENTKKTYKKKEHVEDKAQQKQNTGTVSVSNDSIKENDVSTPQSTPSYNDNDYYYDGGSSYEESWMIPGFEASWYQEQNNIIFDVSIQESEASGYVVMKRKNPNVQIQTWQIKEYTCIDNKDGGRFIINKADYEEGVYDIFLYTQAYGIGPCYIYHLCKENMGGKYTSKEPQISQVGCEAANDGSGQVTYKFQMTDCTEVKYKVIKRTDRNKEYDPAIVSTYDGFDGTVSKSTKELEITINPLVTGSGTYDVIVYGINRAADDDFNNVYRHLDVLGVECEISPTLKVEQQENEINKQSFKVTTGSIEKDTNIVERRYAVVKQADRNTPIEEITKDKIKNPTTIANVVDSGTFTDGGIIELSLDKLGAGYYSLVCYTENNLGCGKFTRISSIMLSKGMEAKIEVSGENVKDVGTSTPRYVQHVTIQTEDDLNDKYEVKYFVSEKDYAAENINIDEELFENKELVKEEIKTVKINKGEKINVDLTAEKDKTKDKYVYVLSKPDIEDARYSLGYRTGAIRVDGTPLKVINVEIEPDGDDANKKSFKPGETIKVNVRFNHDVQAPTKHGYPFLVLKIGDKKYYQTDVTYEGACVTYQYVVTADTPNGAISIDDIFYNLNDYGYYGKDAESYITQPTVESIKDVNFVDGKGYYVDTVAPKFTNAELRITGATVQDRTVNGKHVKYIKDFEKVELVATYSEKVTGPATTAWIAVGRKAVFPVFNHCDGERTEEVWDITSDLRKEDVKKIEGNAYFWGNGCKNDKIADMAGNVYVTNDDPETKYVINGALVSGADVIFDSTVIEPEIYVGNKRVENDATYNTEVSYKVFAEFNARENWNDVNGMKDNKVKLNVNYKDNNQVTVYGRDGEVLTNGVVTTNADSDLNKTVVYEIPVNQLPAQLKLESEGTYEITAIKEDGIGNQASKTVQVSTKTQVAIRRDKCQVMTVDGGMPVDTSKFYCVSDIKLKYSFGFESDQIDLRDVKLYVDDDMSKSYNTMFIDEQDHIGYFQFPINRGGKFTVTLVNEAGEEILRDYVEATNVYMLGDADFDGKITAMDTIVLLKWIAKMNVYLPEVVPYAGNVNGSVRNGEPEMDVSDVVLLCRFLTEDVTANIHRSDKNTPYTHKGGN